MQTELTENDLRCLEALQRAGGSAKLTTCLYQLYRQDTVFSYEEILESFTRLIQGKFVYSFAFNRDLYHIARRGRKALRGGKIVFDERTVDSPFEESQFLEAKQEALVRWKLWEEGTLKTPTCWNVFSVLLWVLSLALLAGGILFVCLYQGTIGWRIGVCVAGVVLYCVVGTFDSFVCSPRCSDRMGFFITVVTFPSYALLALILLGLGYS